MIVYHGGVEIIRKPCIALGRPDVDFGKGFYTTRNKPQAIRWAKRRAVFFDKPMGIVSIYEYNDQNILQTKNFEGYSESWLDFVIQSRTLNDRKAESYSYDLVIGNVADDDVINAIDRYIEQVEKGRNTPTLKKALLEELSFSKPNNQICFASEKSLEMLSFQDYEEIQK